MSDRLIGKKLGDYLIQDVLGQGGMARVYRGYDERLDRHAAIKVIEPGRVSTDDEEEYRERFLREARAIARLNHPSIVSVFQFGQDEEKTLYYMAMRFLDGRDLRHILKDYAKEKRILSNAEVLGIMRDMTAALDYAHQQGVIHRDIKPSNIVIGTDGRAVLTDFGLALNAQEGTVGNTFGSVHYIAPEQAVSSSQASAQSDIYSLGVVLYEMLTGKVPFEDVSAMSVALKHISDPPPPPTTLNEKIRQEVEAVVLRALDKDPNRRYRSGVEFYKALERAITGMDTDQDISSTATTAQKPEAEAETWDDDDMELKPIPRPQFPSLEEVAAESEKQQDAASSRPYNPLEGSRPVPPFAPVPEQKKRRGGLLVALVALVLILVIGSGGLIASGILDMDPAPTNTAPAIAAATEEIIAVATDEPTPTATDTAEPTATTTPPPSDTATNTTEPTATATPPPSDTPTETSEPTITPTIAPTTTPGVIQGPGEPQILLRYDERQLVFYNRSTSSSISGVGQYAFVRPGNGQRFNASSWGISRLDAQNCLQVLAFPSFVDVITTRDCDNPASFFATGNHFWVSSEADTFELLLNGEVISACPTYTADDERLKSCLIKLPED